MRLRYLILVLPLLWLPSARAAAITAASCSQANVQTAIDSAVSGDTVIVPGPCTVSWASAVTISSTQGITVQASGSVTLTDFGFLDSFTNPTVLTRITGFTFTSPGDGNGTPRAIIMGADPTNTTYRIDHNTFTNDAQSVFIGIYGLGPALIDHNTFTGGGASEEIHVYALPAGDASGWSDDVTPGGPAMVFIEDNTFSNFSTTTICSGVQSYQGARTVIRYNTFNYCQIDQHGTGDAVGARWWEAYDNVFNTPNGQNNCCLITMRAGSGVIWGNTATGVNTGGGTIEVVEENSGYPALFQIGRGISQNLSPAYIWGNASIPVFSGSSNVVEGRDYFLSTNQPSSLDNCELFTDTGNSSSCSTTYSYTPYTYPHPLVSRGEEAVMVSEAPATVPVEPVPVLLPAEPSPTESSPAEPTPTLQPSADSLPSGLVLYWTFDTADISDGIIRDKSGNDNTGMFVGNLQSAGGILNQALSFGGSTSYMLATYNVGGFTHSLTLAAWIRTASVSRTEAIFADFNAAASGAGFIFTTDQNGNLAVRLGGTDILAYPNVVTDPSVVNDGQWHHVVATISFELQTIQFYVDGKLTSTTVVNMVPNGDGGSALQVGVAPWTGYGDFFTGAIDEIQVYNRALTKSEVNTVYQLSGGLQ